MKFKDLHTTFYDGFLNWIRSIDPVRFSLFLETLLFYFNVIYIIITRLIVINIAPELFLLLHAC